MKHSITTLIFFCIFIPIYGQTEDYTKYQDTVFIRSDKDETGKKIKYKTDTVIFESSMRRHVLTGTTVLPATHNQFNAQWSYGLLLDKIRKSDCQGNAEEFMGNGGVLQNKINSIISTDTTMIIDINFYENCCYDFLCDISVSKEGDVLNVIFNGYGTHCDCDCCYGLTYYITKQKNPEFKKIKSVMIYGDSKSIKKLN